VKAVLGGDDIDGLPEHEIRRFEADEHGRTRVPESPNGSYVIASAPGAWGYRRVEPLEPAPLRVELFRDFPLSARVVDEAGSPVSGVRVSLRMRWSEWFTDLAVATTRGDGVATLAHAGHAFHREQDADRIALLALCEALDPPVEAAFEPDTPPQEPVELVLPRCGSALVRAVTTDGSPYRGPLDISLWPFAPEKQPDFDDFQGQPAVHRDVAEGGVVTFAHVSLGKRLVATATRDESEVGHSAQALGPKVADERVEIEIRIGEKVSMVAGRLLDDRGNALRNTRFRAEVEVDGAADAIERVLSPRTDAEGRFQFDLSSGEDFAQGRTLALFTVEPLRGPLAIARKPLPAKLAAGLNDLGDFTLRTEPLLVSGRVVDGEGKPLGGVSVAIASLESWEGDESETYWAERPRLVVRSDARGEFGVRASLKSSQISLTATLDQLRSEPVIVAPGAQGVELVLGAGGEIAGVVLLDPSVPSRLVRVQANREDDGALLTENDSTWTMAALDESGAFTLRGLRAGNYSVHVLHAGSWQELASVDALAVTAGRTTRDPRLDPLDLRETHRAIVLTLVDEADVPVQSGLLAVRHAGAPDLESNEFHNGKATLFSAGEPLDVTVIATGLLTYRAADVLESRRIVLRRGPELRFLLGGGQSVPEPPLFLGVRIESSSEGDGFLDWYNDTPDFGRDGVASLRAHRTGRCRVVLTLTKRNENAYTSIDFDAETERTIDVLDRAGVQTFEVRYDASKLAPTAKLLD